MTLSGKKILQVLPALDAGGVERTTLEITEALSAAGAVAHIVSAGGRLEADIRQAGGVLHTLALDTKNPLRVARNRAKLINLIQAETLDLVHARSRAPAWSALGAARATGTPFVTTYHGSYSGTIRPKIYYNSVMARGDLVIANSNFIAAHIDATHGVPASRVVTIPRGVDLAAFAPETIDPARLEAMRNYLGADGTKTLCLLPARLTRWKGQGETILAFANLDAQARDSVQCVLAGDPQGRDDYVAELHQLIKTHALEKTVRILPHIHDMPAALLAADWVLAPSQRPEAFGRLAAEASAMARPVITTAHGGGLETVIDDKTGLHIPPKNISAFTQALNKALNLGPDVRARMGEAGRSHIEDNFTKTLLQQRTLDVYAQLLQD